VAIAGPGGGWSASPIVVPVDRPPFASLLLRLRQAAGLTQEELATRARVGVRTVRDLEAGRATRPQRSTVDLLAAALGLTGTDRARFEAASRGRPVPLVSLPRVEPLIGRDEDVAEVARLLEIADLVTIVGMAGVGKAVLAITVANEVGYRFPGGVGAVRVTEVSTEAEVLASVASALTASPVGELHSHLRLRPADRALLVVTNTDRSPSAAISAIGWLRQHTGVRILATSRQPLGVAGEHQWALGPLEVPPPDATGAAVLAYPAARLFADRLRRVRAKPVTEADMPVLGELVRRLGGLPFALQLAAARGRVLDLSELLARASRGPVSDVVDPAGQTVRSAVLASWDLLTPVEQTALCWLSTFQWRWSIDLAEELLAACPEMAGSDPIAIIDRLVGLGLVRARGDSSPGGTAAAAPRLHVFDAVRQVALEQAQARGILAAARDQHATVIARVCARAVPVNAGGRASHSASDGAAGTDSAALIAYLLADVQAAADHVGVLGSVPRQRGEGAPGVSVDELRGALVRWLARA
jgi:transcriptional regulator with XRE-family HTH domain